MATLNNITYDALAVAPVVTAWNGHPRNINIRAKVIIDSLLSRIVRMFKYEGGFSYIPAWRREQYTMRNGQSFVARHDNRAWLLAGAPGGELDELFLPTKYWGVSNKKIGTWTQGLEIGKDGVLWKNDNLMQGVMPIVQYYSYMMAQNELSLYRALVNSRSGLVFTSGNKKDVDGVKEYVESLEAGEAAAILTKSLINGLQVQPGAATSGIITDLIECEQYLKAALFNEFGLDANYNMKREALNSVEAQMNSDALLSLPREMLECRKEACEKENELLGDLMDLGHESVEFNGSWYEAEAEIEAAVAQLEAIKENPSGCEDDNAEEIEDKDKEEKEKEKDENTAD